MHSLHDCHYLCSNQNIPHVTYVILSYTTIGYKQSSKKSGNFSDAKTERLQIHLPLYKVFTDHFIGFSDDELHSIHSPIIEDSDNEEDEAKHLLPTPANDMHSVDVPPKLAKDLL